MFSGRRILVRLSRRSTIRTLCSNHKAITSCSNNGKVSSNSNKEVENAVALSRKDAYKQLETLDFMTAAKMLFTEPPKKKKFGYFYKGFSLTFYRTVCLLVCISISCYIPVLYIDML
ncbi:hypothetical protein FXO37_11057 [Capsicum annuum]|nr:hypothetical protein FXO37_11057 [Capsicum annuum]